MTYISQSPLLNDVYLCYAYEQSIANPIKTA